MILSRGFLYVVGFVLLAVVPSAPAFHYVHTPLVRLGVTLGPPGSGVFQSMKIEDFSIEGGYVAFIGDCGQGAGVYRISYDGITEIATPQTFSPNTTVKFVEFFEVALFNGDVYFRATDAITAGIFRWRNGVITRVVDTTYVIPGTTLRISGLGDIRPSVNYVGFTARSGENGGLFAARNGILTRIYDASINAPGAMEPFASAHDLEWYSNLPMFIGVPSTNAPIPVLSFSGSLRRLRDPLAGDGTLASWATADGWFTWAHVDGNYMSVGKSYAGSAAYRVADTDRFAPGEGGRFIRFDTLAIDNGAVAFLGASIQAALSDLYSDMGGEVQHVFGAEEIGNPAVVSLTFNREGMSGRSLAVIAVPNETVPTLYRIEGVSSSVRPVPGDYDGDGRTDLAMFDPESAMWFIRRSTDGQRLTRHFGYAGVQPVPADYDGDGRTDIAVYSPAQGLWSISGSQAGLFTRSFGYHNTTAAPADYDGDGTDDMAIFDARNGAWYIQASTEGLRQFAFGYNGCRPVVADYDGDGRADVAVLDAHFVWYIQQSQDGLITRHFGFGSSAPVPADYDGDGSADVAVYDANSGMWYLSNAAGELTVRHFGYASTRAAPGDYDNDGIADIGLLDYVLGDWFVMRSTEGLLIQ